MRYWLHNNGVIRDTEECPGHGLYCKPQLVAVIPVEDREQVMRLRSALIHADVLDIAWDESVSRSKVQAALREFADPKPPRPEEPKGHLAVVEDAHGVRWVNWRDPRDGHVEHRHCWQSSAMDTDAWRDYADIDVVRVLSEGVQP